MSDDTRGTTRPNVRWAPSVGPTVGLVLAVGLGAPASLSAQSPAHLEHPPAEFERLLYRESFEVEESKGLRYVDDPKLQAVLRFADGKRARVKLVSAPHGGGKFNNRPRYEAAVYELQKLFLEEDEYVVPPTVCRCVPPWKFEELFGDARPTFDGTPCRMVMLQAWLRGVTDEEVFDRDRSESDTAYARHLANVDVLTYLVDHKDANKGNVVVAQKFLSSRVFAVDNGVTFASQPGNRGTEWRHLRVERIPRETIERLQGVTLGDLEAHLATIAQFETQPEGMVPVEPAPPFDPEEGIRLKDGVLQIGLTRDEIEDIHERIQELLERIDEGEVETF